MAYEELITALQNVGRDPSHLVFEDELTRLYNRRFFLHYLEKKIPWDDLEQHPAALLMMDLDHFKSINDTHGHMSGDHALIHVARLLKEVAGPAGLPIRYAGDEFMLLLPDTQKDAALKVAERLLQRCRAEPLALEGGAIVLQLRLSVGVASLPGDAQDGKGLIERADAALYYAKRSGRNRLANAAEVGVSDIPEKAALQNLKTPHIVGRRQQLAQVSECYERFSRGHTQFLVAEGAAGMGKTAFLEAVWQAVRLEGVKRVQVNGVGQEAYRPYYMATRIILELLNQRPDRGESLLESLSLDEITYLANILPQFEGQVRGPSDEDEQSQRQGIFTTLVNFIPKLADFQPLILLIDDLQFADAATLLLLRLLMLRREIPIFICGTSMGSVSLAGGDEQAPLERFYSAHKEELQFTNILLSPLTATDIRERLHALFPQISVTEGFVQSLERVSQGNPLLLGEVLRKLVWDQKIILEGDHWTSLPLGDTYLPESLEEIVNQKISALDDESRELLARASTFGEDVSLSMFAGSTDKVEAKVDEFLERSVELGLLSSDFHDNDEVIRFLGKRIREIVYGNIEENQRHQMHENIGSYQEGLYERRLLPSASYLAYHFKRSSNHSKARIYEDIQATQSAKVFNIEEAMDYSGDLPGESLPDTPLDPDSAPEIPVVLRCLLTAVRNIKFYPAESQTVTSANLQLLEAITQVLVKNERLRVSHEEQALLVNGQQFDLSEHKSVTDKLLELLKGVELGSLAFSRGLEETELNEFLVGFAQIKSAETVDQRFWKRFSVRNKLQHIHVKQVQYVERGTRVEDTPHTLAVSQNLEWESPAQLHGVVRSLLSAVKNFKLYPVKSKTVTTSIEQLVGSLALCLNKQSSFTLGRAGDSSLLVNGEKVDVSEFKAVADNFLEFLTATGLYSLTFMEGVNAEQVEHFLVLLSDLPSSGVNPGHWQGTSKDRRMSKILVNEYLYGVLPETFAAPVPDEPKKPTEEEPFEMFLEAVPERVNELLIKDDTDLIRQTIGRMFEDVQSRDRKVREKVIETCGLVAEKIPVGFRQNWTQLVVDPLFGVCSEEKDPNIFDATATLLRKMAESSIPVAEYRLAIRILSTLLSRQQELEKTKDVRAKDLANILERKPDPKIQSLLAADLKSDNQMRQQAAVQLLGSLGPASLPLLIEVIKQEDDLRVREIAAGLLADLGAKAGKAMKQELATEVTAQARSRMLEVIDTVTSALEAEVAFALGDQDRRVRKAAFQLAERLNTKEVGAVLLNYADSPQVKVATGAIKCLGKLKPPGTTERLISVLNSTKEIERAVACCQALAQVADERGIEALARILAQKGFLFFGRRWNPQIRGAAAFALKQIPRSKASELLKPLLKDEDPRVRQIAHALLKDKG